MITRLVLGLLLLASGFAMLMPSLIATFRNPSRTSESGYGLQSHYGNQAAGGVPVVQTGEAGAKEADGSAKPEQVAEEILTTAQQSIRRVKSLAYAAEYWGTGAFSATSPVARGEVRLARLEPDNPFKAKLAVQGVFSLTGNASPRSFRVAFDGTEIRWIDAAHKVVVHETPDATSPRERDLAYVTSFFGGGPYQLVLFEYLQENPFAVGTPLRHVRYEGQTAVKEVLCHVVYVEHGTPDGQKVRKRWFIGAKDHLPRRLEILDEDNGQTGTYVLTLSDLRVDLPPGAPDFTIPVPQGYGLKQHQVTARPALLAVGSRAPEWELNDAAGVRHTLSEYSGQVVVLDFWATWCGPCIKTMADLQRLHETFKGRGVTVLGINAWEEQEPAAFMRERGFSYGLLLKGEQVAVSYRVSLLPVVYVIGYDGTILHRFEGSDKNLPAIIEGYLRQRGR